MPQPPDFDRRRFVGVAAATVAAGPLGLLERINTMTHAVTDVAQPKGRAGTEIRRFSFKASDADLADLRRRINATKWPGGGGGRIHPAAVRSAQCRSSRGYGAIEKEGRRVRASLVQ